MCVAHSTSRRQSYRRLVTEITMKWHISIYVQRLRMISTISFEVNQTWKWKQSQMVMIDVDFDEQFHQNERNLWEQAAHAHDAFALLSKH